MNHPDCEIIECEQRSDEWFSHRRGILTASEFGQWITKKSDKRSLSARETAICKLIAQTAEAWEAPNFESEAMKRGTELEPEAIASFEEATGKTVRDVGFCRSKHGLFGCSPDGLIEGENCRIESKVPIPATHVKYRRAGELPSEYYWQVQGSMAVTGASSWWFQAYNPGLVPLRIKVERDKMTDRLFSALCEFSGELEAAIAEEGEAWRKEFGKGEG